MIWPRCCEWGDLAPVRGGELYSRGFFIRFFGIIQRHPE